MVVKKEKKDKIVKPKIQTAKPQKKEEQRFFAEDLATKMGIDKFEFLLIKRETGWSNDSIVTDSEMQKIYNKIAKR